MKDDLIRRSDAIDAIEYVTWYHQNRNKDMVEGANSDEHQAWYRAEDVYEALKAVPSADRASTATDMFNALQEAEYRGYMKAVADRPQGEWIDKAISIIDDMREEGIVDYEQAWEFRMRTRMKGADDD